MYRTGGEIKEDGELKERKIIFRKTEEIKKRRVNSRKRGGEIKDDDSKMN